MVKDVYPLQMGLPIWKHLMNNGEKHTARLNGSDYGRMAERVGVRELKNLIKYSGFLNTVFPGLNIISLNRLKKRGHYSLEYGDYAIEINHVDGSGTFGKKVLIVEIKHGLIEISQQQIQRYSNYVINPRAYFRKADEVKILFMLFTRIDTMSAKADYCLSEFNKEFANRIIDAIPKHEPGVPDNLFECFGDEFKRHQ